MAKLLSRPHIHTEECLVSYLIRVAEQNGFKHIGHLLHYAGLDWKNNRAPVHRILTGEFDLAPYLLELGLSENQSKIALTYQSFLRGIDTPHLLVKYPKVCPECIEESGYGRYEWAILPVLTCCKHQKMLVDTQPKTGKRLSWYRQRLNSFDSDNTVIKISKYAASPVTLMLSGYVEGLLHRRNKSAGIPEVLHGLKLNESLSLIHFVAHYQARLMGETFNPVAMENIDLSRHYQRAWKMLLAWPDSFYSLLSQYVDRPMSSKGQAGLNKHFRDLYERLHRQQENQGIARIKAEFDRYIEEYWPGVLEPERLTRIRLALAARNIISKKEAANILGSRLERIDKLVQQGRITPVVFKGKAHYQRDQVEALANEMSSNWTMAEACEALELTRYQLKQLLDADIIPALQKPDSLNRDWVVDKLGCLALITALRSNARKSESPSGAVSMAGIQRKGYSIVQLVLSMQSGELQYSVVADVDGATSLKQFFGFKINNMA